MLPGMTPFELGELCRIEAARSLAVFWSIFLRRREEQWMHDGSKSLPSASIGREISRHAKIGGSITRRGPPPLLGPVWQDVRGATLAPPHGRAAPATVGGCAPRTLG